MQVFRASEVSGYGEEEMSLVKKLQFTNLRDIPFLVNKGATERVSFFFFRQFLLADQDESPKTHLSLLREIVRSRFFIFF